MTCCLYIHSGPWHDAYKEATLSSPLSSCSLSRVYTLCWLYYKETNQQRNMKWKALTCCDLQEVDKCNNPQPAIPLSGPQDQLTHVCVFTHAYSQPSALPQPQYLPSSRFSTHTNKPRRPCPVWLPHTDRLPFTVLKLHASLPLFTFQIFHNFIYSIP